ncbi:MAG: PspC domain-containing protein [Streptococcus sp.]|nr:PspC domain-containing protein [Streptococcus sp.]
MKVELYKQRKGKMLSGVLSGLADKYHWDINLCRILFGVFVYFSFGFAVFIYILLACILPYKEDIIDEQFGRGPRKRKEAERVEDNDGWFW